MTPVCWTSTTVTAAAPLARSALRTIRGRMMRSTSTKRSTLPNYDGLVRVSFTTRHIASFSKKRRWHEFQNFVKPLTFEAQRRTFFSNFCGNDDKGASKDNDRTSHNTNVGVNVSKKWEDNYRRPITRELWDEFKDEGKRTRAYLSCQSQTTASSNGYQEILSELHASIHETWNGHNAYDPPPEHGPTGTWTYRFETDGTGNRIYQRSLSSNDSEPEIVLELPPTAEALAMSLTPDEALIACLMETNENSQTSQIKLCSVASKKQSTILSAEWLGDIGPSEVVGLEWGPILTRNNSTGVYSLYLLLTDHQGRPDRVALCRVDPLTLKSTVPPSLIYASNDPAVMVDVQRTKGCDFVSIRALSKTSSEIFLSRGDEELILVRAKEDKIVYHVDVGNEGDVVILTSDENHPNGGDYCLEETTVETLPLSKQTPPLSIDEQGDYFVEDMDLFQSHLVLYERSRRNGEQRMRLRERSSQNSKSKEIVLDFSRNQTSEFGNENGSLVWSKLSPVGNMCFESPFFRFELESPVAPGLVYEYEFDSQQVTMASKRIGADRHQDSLPIGGLFQREMMMVESLDGTEVPLTIFSKTEKNAMNQPKTIVLVGYGAYGEPMDLGYNPGWKSLLDRGVMIAFAHTRGGGDLGRDWYANGRRENKIRGIEDYEACAFYLRERFDGKSSEGDQQSLSLVAKAFSAGGVLIGAAVNRNPGLFDKVLLTNAFVDVASTMDKPNLFLTEHEYDEFGNPQTDPIAKEMIQSYCPVYNLQPLVQSKQTSTQFLLIGTLDDQNVPYWNATLYFRKLLEGFDILNNSETGRDHRNETIFLELQTSGGHHFSGPNRIEVLALENAFILKEVEKF